MLRVVGVKIVLASCTASLNRLRLVRSPQVIVAFLPSEGAREHTLYLEFWPLQSHFIFQLAAEEMLYAKGRIIPR